VETVRVRLSRARERLRDRLIRRGIGPERVAAVGWVTADPVANLPLAPRSSAGNLLGGAAWVEATVKGARALGAGRAAGAGAVPASVVFSDEGVIRSMAVNRWKTVAILLLATAMTVAGAIVFAAGGPGAQDKGESPKDQPGVSTP